MSNLIYIIPIALFLGGLGLAAFLWSLKSGQYDDLEGAAWRVLDDDDAGPKGIKMAPADVWCRFQSHLVGRNIACGDIKPDLLPPPPCGEVERCITQGSGGGSAIIKTINRLW